MLLCLCPPLSSCTNTEPSLTPHNLTTALDTLPNKVWHDFGDWIDVPRSKRDNIKYQYRYDGERKSALLHTYLTSHPAPSWQHITHALFTDVMVETTMLFWRGCRGCSPQVTSVMDMLIYIHACTHSCAWYMYNTYTCTVYTDYEIHKVGTTKVLPNLTSLPAFHSTNMY